MLDFLHVVGGARCSVSTISKLETNRKGHTIGTLKNGTRILMVEPLAEAQKVLDHYKVMHFSLDDNDLGGPSGEQLFDEKGKSIF